jgi:hypothetical protein
MINKKLTTIFLIWNVTILSLLAQVKVDLVLDRQQYLAGESVPIQLKITNLSGQTFSLSDEDQWLSFTLDLSSGYIVEKFDQVPPSGKFDVPSGSVVTKVIDLATYYNLSQSGRYKISATIKISNWGQSFSSPETYFDIISGNVIWQEDIGVPPSDNTNSPPAVRKYELVRANLLKQFRLYARIKDVTSGKLIALTYIGPMVSFSKPEAQIDSASNLHVLNQTYARTFIYCALNPNGEIIRRQTYDCGSSRPTLKPENGSIGVKGGTRVYLKTDIPIEEPNSTNAPNSKSSDTKN